MRRRNTRFRVDRRSNLPDLVQRFSLGRNFDGGEDDQPAVGRFSSDVPERKGELRRRKNRGVGRNVEGSDRGGVAGESGEEGLRSNHASGGGVDGPGNPAAGARRRGEEGDGERGIFGIVGPVEKGVEMGEILAVGEGSVGE